jgi:hypothetical protein
MWIYIGDARRTGLAVFLQTYAPAIISSLGLNSG